MNDYVLVVDDEPEIISLLDSLLTEEGYVVRTATNGLEALAMVAHQPPSVMLLDVLMPALDGIGVLTYLQTHDIHAFPVIVMSASHFDLATLQALGAVTLLAKPFDINHLIACIEQSLSHV